MGQVLKFPGLLSRLGTNQYIYIYIFIYIYIYTEIEIDR